MLYIYLSALNTDEEKNYFEEIYLSYRQKMYGIAYSILHNVQDSEDAVHQAFLKMADNFQKILSIPRQELPSYIVIIIRNTSINIYNKNKKTAERSAELPEDQTAIDIDFFENINYEQLVSVISHLPDKYKDILFLHYINDFSCKEISKMLDISVDNVWKRIERAKKALKKALEEGENDE
jgi:RNA polymerase sigma-70 factor (ECF subfamily)